ncbi:hypothetical protein SUGI_0110150 [Cryptomeria japonica]|nr:hypothetical protein SUGI_0110150 [Cryptomeria japonica]
MGRSPCCLKVGLQTGPWTPQEDNLLTNYIASHGEGDWRNLGPKAGLRRCGKSCRLRWLNYLRPTIKRGNISADEEDLIIRLHRLLGNRWSLIAGRLPGRTDNEIKNYWNTHLTKKLRMAGTDPHTHKPLHNNINPTGQNIHQAVTVTGCPSTITVNKRKELPSSNSKNERVSTSMQEQLLHPPMPNRLKPFPRTPKNVSEDKKNSTAMGDMLKDPTIAVNQNLEDCSPDSSTCYDMNHSSSSTVEDGFHSQQSIISCMQQCYNDDEYKGFDSEELQTIFQEYSRLLEHDQSHDLDKRKVQLSDDAV